MPISKIKVPNSELYKSLFLSVFVLFKQFFVNTLVEIAEYLRPQSKTEADNRLNIWSNSPIDQIDNGNDLPSLYFSDRGFLPPLSTAHNTLESSILGIYLCCSDKNFLNRLAMNSLPKPSCMP